MNTEIVKLDAANIDETAIERAAEIIKNGGLVAFPTETVYGIAASALSEKGIDKVYQAKNRPREKAINLMVSNIKQSLPESINYFPAD